MRNFLTLVLTFFFVNAFLQAQPYTFQRVITGAGSMNIFDGKATPDGGFVMVGIADDMGTSRPVIIKLDCKGDLEWNKTFEPSSTIQNIGQSLAVMPDSSILAVVNVGTYQSYDMIVLRIDKSGNTLWRKIINAGLGDTGGYAINATADGGVVVAGYTNVFGSETPGSSYRDVYLLRFDGDGNLLWSRTFGTKQAYDEADAVIQTSDGGFALTGRIIDRGAFHAFLMRTNADGELQSVRTYGDSLHSNRGFDLRELSDGGFAFVGSTTILQDNFQSYHDNFIIRTNAVGDTTWTRVFWGTPNSFENASSLVLDQEENFLIGVATACYPTSGFVPNKHMVAKFSKKGALQVANLYNRGSSHYPYIANALDGGFFLSGFSTRYTTNFSGLAIKMDENLDAGCFTEDVTSLTPSSPGPFVVRAPAISSGQGAIVANFPNESFMTVRDSVLCRQDPPPPVADFQIASACVGDTVSFSSIGMGNIISYQWFVNDSLIGEQPTAAFVAPAIASYSARLVVSDGCRLDTLDQSFEPLALPIVGLGPDTTACQDSLLVLDAGSDFAAYLWSDGSTGQFLETTDEGLFWVEVSDGQCMGADSLLVRRIDCDTIQSDLLIIPNAFTPNGDGNNDLWRATIGPDYELLDLRIFNRWGERVFASEETLKFEWDGTHNGEPQPAEIYIFVLKLSFLGAERIEKGNITLLR